MSMNECGIHAEVMYETPEGNVGSDFCSGKIGMTPEWAQHLREQFDEWLTKSNGTGFFVVAPDAYDESCGWSQDDKDKAFGMFRQFEKLPAETRVRLLSLLLSQ